MNQRPVNKILIKKKDGKIKPLSFDLEEQQAGAASAVSSKQDEGKTMSVPPAQDIQKEKKVPDFYFHIEDEEEAGKFFDQGRHDLGNKKKKLIDIYIKEILLFFDTILVSFSESRLEKMKRVLESYLRGTRSFLDFKLILGEEGPVGFSLDEESAYKIVKKTEEKKKELDDLDNVGLVGKLDVMDKKKEVQKIEKEDDGEKMIKEKIEKPRVVSPEVEIKSPDVLPKVEAEPVRKNPMMDEVRSGVSSTQDIKKPVEAESGYAITKDERVDVLKKDPVKKVVPQKITKGSLEEIEEINLVEFRKGGDNSKARVNKVYDKIKLLENQSTSKRVAGIMAWKKSPVYKEYVAIGEKSLLEKKKIEEVIREKNTLTLDEFNAIADLNNELNY